MADENAVRPARLADYPLSRQIETRWADNDVYGHVNNIAYYGWFDTVVNRVLIERGLLDVQSSEVIALVVESGCRFHRPVAFPESPVLGIGISHLGRSSLLWRLGVFVGPNDVARADGKFVHVCVSRALGVPVPWPALWRSALADLIMPSETLAASELSKGEAR